MLSLFLSGVMAFRPPRAEPLPTISYFEWEGRVENGGGAKLADCS